MAINDLLALMELHVLPPVPVLGATWTTPFFGSNPQLATWLGPSLTAAAATSGYSLSFFYTEQSVLPKVMYATWTSVVMTHSLTSH